MSTRQSEIMVWYPNKEISWELRQKTFIDKNKKLGCTSYELLLWGCIESTTCYSLHWVSNVDKTSFICREQMETFIEF